jgi:DNA-binding Lrp family transcriptional regulator
MPRGDFHKKIGQMREQQVVDALKDKQMTVEQLASALGMSPSSIAIYVTRLHEEPKRVYVSGHERRLSGMPAVLWSAGSSPDVEFVPLSMPTRKVSAAERIEQVIALLEAQPRTLRDIAKVMHMVPRAAGKYVSLLRAGDEQRIYIARWLSPRVTHPGQRAGSWAPVYAVGNKADKPMPKKETSAERHARRYQSREIREMETARRKRDYTLKKAKAKPATWFTALPGAKSLQAKTST